MSEKSLLEQQHELDAMTRGRSGPPTQAMVDALNAMRARHGLPPRSMSEVDDSWRKGEGRAPIENFWRFITGRGA